MVELKIGFYTNIKGLFYVLDYGWCKMVNTLYSVEMPIINV